MEVEHKPRSATVSTVSAPRRDSKPRNGGLLDSTDTLPVFKFTVIFLLAISTTAMCILSPNDFFRSRAQFLHWYTQYVYQFHYIAKNYCTKPYSVYLYGTRQNISDVSLSGAGEFTLFIQPMIQCLLKHTSEYISYQLASSQVILGLTPTIIALLGSSLEEVCLIALIGRRRLLGFLLAAASPSVYTERAFRYKDPDKILEERLNASHCNEDHVGPAMEGGLRRFFVLLEYIAVIAAVGNVGTLNWQLGVRSINAVNANTVLMPMMWSILGIYVHLGGAVVFSMRAQRRDENNPIYRPTVRSSLHALIRWIRRPAISTWPKKCKDMVVRELSIRHTGLKKSLVVETIPESRWFTFLAWFLSVFVVFHIILGTLILASTTFVGPKDALGVMARFVMSVITCRVVLLYELAILRVQYKNGSLAKFGEVQAMREEDDQC